MTTTMSLKEKVKVYFSDIPAIAKLQPIITVTMLFGIGYGIVTLIISTAELSFYIGITGSYSLILGIFKLNALKKYKGLAEIECSEITKEIEANAAKSIAVCASVLSFLHFSFAIVSTFFYEENPKNYDLFILMFVAGSAFVKIILATVMSIKTRKNHSPIIHHIKLADNANALISLALTQRSILYFTEYPYAKIVSGIGGIFFSISAGIVCFLMFKKLKTE